MIGRIYKIISEQTDKIYYGSTKNKLSRRFGTHKQKFKNCKCSRY